MWKLLGSINVEFLVGLGFWPWNVATRDVVQFCGISRSEALFCLGFSWDKSKNSRIFCKTLCPQTPFAFFLDQPKWSRKRNPEPDWIYRSITTSVQIKLHISEVPHINIIYSLKFNVQLASWRHNSQLSNKLQKTSYQ